MAWLINFLKSLFGIKSAAQTSSTARADQLVPADYSESFFSGRLGNVPIPPYKLPAGARGYGSDGEYTRYAFDPRFYDAAKGRILGSGGLYIDVATRTRYYPDGATDQVAPEVIRQWLYGLSIDPASVPGDLLSLALVNAPRQISRSPLGAGQGAFGA